MKYLPLAAILICTAGCGIFGGDSDSKPNTSRPADPGDSGRPDNGAKIAAKKQELAQVDSDLSKINSERTQLASQPASETKTNRLVELARLESDLNLKRSSLSEDIAQLGGSAPKAKSADPLDDIIATNETKEKEEADRRRKKAEDDASADKARIAAAEAARKAELDERSKQKIEGGRLAQGPDAPAFEDRWADVIQKIRGELQKYKRW